MRILWNILRKPILLVSKILQQFANLFWGRPLYIYDKETHPLPKYITNPDLNIEAFWVFFDFEDYDEFYEVIKQYPSLIEREDHYGKTMIHYIACYGTSRNLEILQKYDAKLFKKLVFEDNNLPLLHCALYAMNGEVMDYLVNTLHISPNVLDGDGRNAANIIDTLKQSKSNLPMETLLLLAICFDIELDHQTDAGDTLLHTAVKEQNWQAVELLLSLHPALVHKLFQRLHNFRMKLNDAQHNGRFVDNRFRLTSFVINLFLRPYFHVRLCFKNRWILLETIRNVIGLIVFAYQIQGLFYDRLPRYLSFYYKEHYDKNEIIHGIFLSNFLMGCIAFAAVYFSRSQFIPTNTQQYEQFMAHICNKKLTNKSRGVVFDDTVNLRFERPCNICKCFRFENDKHCYTCNRCVTGYDHHCVFLFSCIGKRNLGAFVTFLVSMTIGGVLSIYFLAYYMLPIYFAWEMRYLPWYKWTSLPTNNIQHFIIIDMMFSFVWCAIGFALLVTTYLRSRFNNLNRNIIKIKGFARRYWKTVKIDDESEDEEESDLEHDDDDDDDDDDDEYWHSAVDDDFCSEQEKLLKPNNINDKDRNDPASGDAWTIV